MTRARIPPRLSDLRSAWLTEVLREAGALERARVTSFVTEPLSANAGFVGTLARLRLEIQPAEPEAPHTLIAKLPSSVARNRSLGEASRAYEHECRFYRDLAAEVPLPTPRVYLSAFDPDPFAALDSPVRRGLEHLPERGLDLAAGALLWLAQFSPRRYVLLLEDVAGDAGDQLAGCGAARCANVLRALAALHARFWEGSGPDELTWLARLDATPLTLHSMFRRGWPAFARSAGARLPMDVPRVGAWLHAHGVELLCALSRSPATLVHGDCRLDNLIFTGDDLRAVVDWQAVVVARGVVDVAYFVCGCLRTEVDSAAELDLVRGYHRALVERGVADYDEATCLRDYQLARLAVLHRLVAAFDSLEVAEGRGAELLECWYGRVAARLRGADLDAATRALAEAGR